MLNDLAIIAGSGKLPLEVASILKKKKLRFIILCIKGFSKTKDYKNYKHYALRMGQGASAINILKKNNIKRLIFLGALERPTLSDLKPDFWTLFKVFKFIFFKKTDDVILRNVVSIFENEGFKVIGLSDITNKFFLKKGVYGYKKIPKTDLKIISNLLNKTLKWTKKDIGQSVITSKKRILYKEDRKGTNYLIKRSLKKKINENSYLFIKVKKLNQDTRVDLPTFGFNTLKNLVKTDIKYIILNANSTVVMNKKKVLKYIMDKKKTILSVDILIKGQNFTVDYE